MSRIDLTPRVYDCMCPEHGDVSSISIHISYTLNCVDIERSYCLACLTDMLDKEIGRVTKKKI